MHYNTSKYHTTAKHQDKKKTFEKLISRINSRDWLRMEQMLSAPLPTRYLGSLPVYLRKYQVPMRGGFVPIHSLLLLGREKKMSHILNTRPYLLPHFIPRSWSWPGPWSCTIIYRIGNYACNLRKELEEKKGSKRRKKGEEGSKETNNKWDSVLALSSAFLQWATS